MRVGQLVGMELPRDRVGQLVRMELASSGAAGEDGLSLPKEATRT